MGVGVLVDVAELVGVTEVGVTWVGRVEGVVRVVGVAVGVAVVVGDCGPMLAGGVLLTVWQAASSNTIAQSERTRKAILLIVIGYRYPSGKLASMRSVTAYFSGRPCWKAARSLVSQSRARSTEAKMPPARCGVRQAFGSWRRG